MLTLPQTTDKKGWEKSCRELMRADMHPNAAWYVTKSRGSIKLEVKEDGQYQSRVLEYEWSQKGFAKALPRIRLIYKNFYSELGNRSLAKSCEIVNTASSKSETNFDEIFKDFRIFCPRPSDKTWKKSYVPVLDNVKRLLTSNKKPVDGEELILKALEQWELGSRSRDIARRALIKFLDYAILRGKLSNNYAPVKTEEKKYQSKRVGFALEENQVLQLIAQEKDQKWKFAYQLLSTYGLRPEEMNHLVIKEGSQGKELWTIYQKSMGGVKGQKTEPRKLEPLYVQDGQGYIEWNLQTRIENNEELPSFKTKTGTGGDVLGAKLRNSRLWQQFRVKAEKQGEQLVPYAFRHRYAKVAHSRSVELGLTIKDIAFVMGHSLEVHQKNYARFIPSDISKKFAKQIAA